jgi:hypothetical protein
MLMLKDWYKKKPELFKKQPYDRPGLDSYRTYAIETL